MTRKDDEAYEFYLDPKNRQTVGPGRKRKGRHRGTLHVCALDRSCRRYGAPRRVYVNTPWFHFAFAYTPSSRFVDRSGRSRWTTYKRWE